MKRVLTGLAAASMMIAVPLAASADDRGRYRGAPGYGYPGHAYKQKHARHYYQPPPVVVYRPAPPRVVGYPVYGPRRVYAPPPIVVAPSPPPVPWPLNQVSIGFRFLF